MSDKQVVVQGSGVGVGTLLFILLVYLKLTGQITMSWIWVCLLPLLTPIVFILLVMGILLVGTLIVGLCGTALIALVSFYEYFTGKKSR